MPRQGTAIPEFDIFVHVLSLRPQATDSYTSRLPRPLHSLPHLEYLQVVESLSEEAREAIWFGRKAKLAADAVVEESPLQEQKGGVLRGVEVERVPAKDLPVAEFLSKYVSSGVPVVITGAAGASVGGDGLWDLDFISKHAGITEINLRHFNFIIFTIMRSRIQGPRPPRSSAGSAVPPSGPGWSQCRSLRLRRP